MDNGIRQNNNILQTQEKDISGGSGMTALITNSMMILVGIAAFVFGILWIERGHTALGVTVVIVSSLFSFIIGPVLYAGLKILKPNEALVLTLFGRYHGTLKGEGFYFVNPFCTAVNPAWDNTMYSAAIKKLAASSGNAENEQVTNLVRSGKKMSLKYMTLDNGRQKINDELGNPIIIGVVVIWRIVNTARAAFNVDNYSEFLSVQTDMALRNIVRLYPYDLSPGEPDNEKSLRGSSQEIAAKLRDEIQAKVEIAGLEISEARITHLAYAPEIAAAMLQRQQASAIIDARQMIVDGAVGMVEMALEKLNENNVVQLDEERKASMVSNLLVVLCGNRDAQPVVNSGSLY